MEWVLEHFKQGKVDYAKDLFLLPYINIGWIKLNKYYALTDKSPAYVSAIVLDPA
jgi:predicted transcriptional regulator